MKPRKPDESNARLTADLLSKRGEIETRDSAGTSEDDARSTKSFSSMSSTRSKSVRRREKTGRMQVEAEAAAQVLDEDLCGRTLSASALFSRQSKSSLDLVSDKFEL